MFEPTNISVIHVSVSYMQYGFGVGEREGSSQIVKNSPRFSRPSVTSLNREGGSLMAATSSTASSPGVTAPLSPTAAMILSPEPVYNYCYSGMHACICDYIYFVWIRRAIIIHSDTSYTFAEGVAPAILLQYIQWSLQQLEGFSFQLS